MRKTVARRRLSDHIYGEDHHLIGKVCAYQGELVIPYGSYTLDAPDHEAC